MKRIVSLIMVGIFLFVSNVYGSILYSDDYIVSRVGTFSFAGMGSAKYMTFDDDGNMYITSDSSSNASIIKITPDGKSKVLLSNGKNFQGIVYANDSLYVAEVYTNRVINVGLDGSIINYTHFSDNPIALTLSPNNSNKLYVGTRQYGGIYTIDQDGVDQIAQYSFSGSNGIYDIAFDQGSQYGGQMYVTVNGRVAATELGVFSVTEEGELTRFLPSSFNSGHVIFDNSEEELFGGNMFASTSSEICCVTPDGSYTSFFSADDQYISHYIFGPDDAMYVLSKTTVTNIYNIDKIYVPEPATVLLSLLGFGIVRGRKSHSK